VGYFLTRLLVTHGHGVVGRSSKAVTFMEVLVRFLRGARDRCRLPGSGFVRQDRKAGAIAGEECQAPGIRIVEARLNKTWGTYKPERPV